MLATIPAADRVVSASDNMPPAPTPIEAARETIADLELEAGNWFDGAEITTAEQADEVSRIIDAARKAAKAFDADRKAEKQPHVDAGKAVDEAWKPLTTAAERIVEVAKGVLTPWLVAQDKAKREREAAARAEADAKIAEARRLADEAKGSLAALKARDEAIEQARVAEFKATAAANDKAGAKGEGMTRTVALRTVWRATVNDRRALLNHIAREAPDDLSAWLDEWAARAVRGGARELPGVEAWQERSAA